MGWLLAGAAQSRAGSRKLEKETLQSGWLAGWLTCYQVKDALHKWPSHVERRVNENDSLVEADLSKKIKPLICEQTVGKRLRQLLASTVFFTTTQTSETMRPS